jgi:DNA modification methylase
MEVGMNFDKENWRDTDLNVDSLWIIGPRAKGGKHTNIYHGNFAPQIPNNMIRRFTEEKDVVLDLFMGSGTTLYECENLNRDYIGFDINEEIIDFVGNSMVDCDNINFTIHNHDVCDTLKTQALVKDDLQRYEKEYVDLVIAHPPYLDIIKFTDKAEDLSNITDINEFTERFIASMHSGIDLLKPKKHFVLVIGDIYRNGEVVPLGFYLMEAIKKNFKCKLKGIIVKDMVGNRAKIGSEALWRYRALRNGNFLFKHEYVFVFRKEK